MNVRVDPGKRRSVETVEYERTGTGGSSYRYTYSWERADPDQ